MAITAAFSPDCGVLTESVDSTDDTIVTSGDAAGQIFVNGGAAAGGTATVANTSEIEVFGQAGNDRRDFPSSQPPTWIGLNCQETLPCRAGA